MSDALWYSKPLGSGMVNSNLLNKIKRKIQGKLKKNPREIAR